MKFKIGKLYKVKNGVREGNIIRITSHDISKSHYGYETVREVSKDTLNNFHVYSSFATYLEPVNECIVIYHKGNEVIALNKIDGSKAVAKCHPDDDFDFMVGAKLAFQRLVGEEAVEPDNNLSVVAKAFRLLVNALLKEDFTSTEAIRIAIGIATSKTKGDN